MYSVVHNLMNKIVIDWYFDKLKFDEFGYPYTETIVRRNYIESFCQIHRYHFFSNFGLNVYVHVHADI